MTISEFLMILTEYQLEQEVEEVYTTLKEEKQKSETEKQRITSYFEEKISKLLEDTEQEKQNSVDIALKHAEKKWIEIANKREADLTRKFQEEKEEMEQKRNEELSLQISITVDKEKQKIVRMEQMICDLKKSHEEEKESILDLVQKQKNQIETLINKSTSLGESVSLSKFQEESEKVRIYCNLSSETQHVHS
jgi:hypothetical protein